MSNGVNFKDLCIDLRRQLDDVTAERDAALVREAALKVSLGISANLSELYVEGIESIRAERDVLQQRLTAADERADERADVLEIVSVKQAALLNELGIPLDEVDDLFGETLKNSKRYEYLRSVMAVENFPAPHPTWSEPSEVESKRIDDLCDAALKPAECCTVSAQDRALLEAGDYTPEELFGIGGKPSCPKCAP